MRCVLLAIDPGVKAGATIAEARIENRSPNGYTPSYLCEDFALRQVFTVKPGGEPRVARDFVDAIGPDHFLVAAESWTPGGWRSHASVVGIGAAWGRWESALESAGIPKRRIVRADPRTWRSAVLSRSRLRRDQWKRMAIQYVQTKYGLTKVSDDAAESICLAEWASKDRNALALMASRPRRIEAGNDRAVTEVSL